MRAESNAADLALALRRYRLVTGAYPREASVLVPLYVHEVGTDPFTGRAIDYTRRGSAFELRIRWPGRGSGNAQQPRTDWTIAH